MLYLTKVAKLADLLTSPGKLGYSIFPPPFNLMAVFFHLID